MLFRSEMHHFRATISAETCLEEASPFLHFITVAAKIRRGALSRLNGGLRDAIWGGKYGVEYDAGDTSAMAPNSNSKRIFTLLEMCGSKVCEMDDADIVRYYTAYYVKTPRWPLRRARGGHEIGNLQLESFLTSHSQAT